MSNATPGTPVNTSRRGTRRVRRTVAGLGALAAVVIGAGTMALPGPTVEAHYDHTSAKELCGGDEYSVKYRHPLYFEISEPPQPPPYLKEIGRVVVLEHDSSDTHCVVLNRKSHEKRWTGVAIKHKGDDGWPDINGVPNPDIGRFETFAGPIWLGRDGGKLIVQGSIGPRDDRKAWVRLQCGASTCEWVDGDIGER